MQFDANNDGALALEKMPAPSIMEAESSLGSTPYSELDAVTMSS